MIYYILGMGISGLSAARFLLAKGERVVGIDRQPRSISGMKCFKESEEVPFERGAVLLLSPGISQDHPLCCKAAEKGVEVIGEAELACRYLKNRAVAVTGTNGKSTVCLMTAHLLQSAGLKAVALGNVGRPLCSYLLEAPEEEIFVVELSSFQLETMGRPVFEAAALLNITPDHLDRYPSFEAYAAAKLRIADCLKPGAPLFIDRKTKESFSVRGAVLKGEGPFPERNREAAFALAGCFGVTEKQCSEALCTFAPPPHRLQFVREIGGVAYYNDSKGTNVDATLQAVFSLERQTVLIAGGVDKRGGYRPWAENFTGKVKAVCAIGEAAQKIKGELSAGFPVLLCGSLEAAMEEAAALAAPGDAVLLSPGCASYDMFKNYEERGKKFVELVNARKESP